jgi:hypothetical protein
MKNTVVVCAIVIFALVFSSCSSETPQESIQTVSESKSAATIEAAATAAATATASATDAQYIKPGTVITSVKPDFLRIDANYKKLNQVIEDFKYNEFLTMVNDYIANNKVDQADNAFKIKSVLTPAIEELKKCNIIFDKHDEVYTVFYKGVKTISKSTNIVPSFYDGASNFRVGFKRSNWLFFDEMSLKLSTGYLIVQSFDSFDMQRDVISGGTICEYTDLGFSDEEKEKILNADSIEIRFKNSDNDKYYDHVCSKAEVDALKSIITIEKTNLLLTELTFF